MNLEYRLNREQVQQNVDIGLMSTLYIPKEMYAYSPRDKHKNNKDSVGKGKPVNPNSIWYRKPKK